MATEAKTVEQSQAMAEILEIQRHAIHIKCCNVKQDLLKVHKKPVPSDVLFFLSEYFKVKINHHEINTTSYIKIEDNQSIIYVELKTETNEQGKTVSVN